MGAIQSLQCYNFKDASSTFIDETPDLYQNATIPCSTVCLAAALSTMAYVAYTCYRNYKPCNGPVRLTNFFKEKFEGINIPVNKNSEILTINSPKVDVQNQKKLQALHLAIKEGHIVTVKNLIENKMDLESINKSGYTPLISAVQKNQLNIVELLLEKGGKVNAQTHLKQTALHFAVNDGEKGHIEIVKKLIENGADLEASDKYGETPLLLAALWGEEDIVELLLAKGANVNAQNHQKQTALHFAISFNYGHKDNIEIIRKLIESGADLEVTQADGNTFLKGATPLMMAVRQNQLNIVELLLEKGAKVNTQDHRKQIALHVAVYCGYIEIVKKLIENGANLEASEEQGYTPLMLAIQLNRLDIVELLLEKGAEVNFKDNFGKTALDWAITKKVPILIIKKLLEKGADPNIEDTSKNTALHHACFIDSVEICNLLAKYGAKINAQNDEGKTPLHIYATMYPCHFEAILKLGADAQISDNLGFPPHYYLFRNEHSFNYFMKKAAPKNRLKVL